MPIPQNIELLIEAIHEVSPNTFARFPEEQIKAAFNAIKILPEMTPDEKHVKLESYRTLVSRIQQISNKTGVAGLGRIGGFVQKSLIPALEAAPRRIIPCNLFNTAA